MSSLQIGIVGLPNVGKSTLFNALTDSEILAANYPFATIEPNTGIVPVPDARLSELETLYNAKKSYQQPLHLLISQGLSQVQVKAKASATNFGHIRNCDAIVHVVRSFVNNDIVHVNDNVSPVDDIEIINTELILADLQSLDKRIPKIQKESKANPKKRSELEYLESLKHELESGKPLSSLPALEHEYIADLHLLTAKPVIYAFNVDETTIADPDATSQLAQLVTPSPSVFISAKLEEELRGLARADALELLESYGVQERGLEQLIHAAYDTLGLQSYLTAGPDEVRAWTIRQGSTAPQAAGVIHGDFERGFIAASIVSYSDLIAAGSEAVAKSQGKVRTEGKEYVMQPDDIVEFRFNVSK